MKNKKGIELAFSKIIWWIILALFLGFVMLWYMGIGDQITNIFENIDLI